MMAKQKHPVDSAPTSQGSPRTTGVNNQKPQGWTTAKKAMKGQEFSCFRCHDVFYNRDDFNDHIYVNPWVNCKKFKEWRKENLADNTKLKKKKKEEGDGPKQPPILYDEAFADVRDSADKSRALKHFFDVLPTYDQLGYPDLRDIPEFARRRTEWHSKQGARDRGEKVFYSWTKKKNPKSQE